MIHQVRNDLAMCPHKRCRKKASCYRYNRTAGNHQVWSMFPLRDDREGCEDFIPLPDLDKKKSLKGGEKRGSSK